MSRFLSLDKILNLDLDNFYVFLLFLLLSPSLLTLIEFISKFGAISELFFELEGCWFLMISGLKMCC